MRKAKRRSSSAGPTMLDVAAAAGVSQATVSLVLSGSKLARLTDATRQRVNEAAERLNYRFVRRSPKSAAAGRSTILFIADEVSTDPWMSLAFEGARDMAMTLGTNVLLAVSHADADIEADLLTSVSKHDLVGVIYGTILTRQVHLPDAFDSHNVVLVNCYDEQEMRPSVIPADLLGGRVATEHLIGIGRRRIALINGQQGLDNPRDRLKGYRQALASNDIPFDPALVRPGNWEPSAGYAMTMELMALDNPPDAIFCANDHMAVGCYDALHKLGLSIPGDVAVVGFDDREIARSMHPPLTTLVLPQYEMGRVAAEMLLDRASGLSMTATRIKVECELVVRASTAVTQRSDIPVAAAG